MKSVNTLGTWAGRGGEGGYPKLSARKAVPGAMGTSQIIGEKKDSCEQKQ